MLQPFFGPKQKEIILNRHHNEGTHTERTVYIITSMYYFDDENKRLPEKLIYPIPKKFQQSQIRQK